MSIHSPQCTFSCFYEKAIIKSFVFAAILTFWGLCTVSPGFAQIVWEQDFTDGLPLDEIWQTPFESYPYTHELDSSCVRIGPYAWRIENRGGNPDPTGKHRAQLYTPEIIPKDEGTEAWSGFSMRIGPWPNIDNSIGTIVYQHKVGSGGPEVEWICKEGGKLYMMLYTDPNKVLVNKDTLTLSYNTYYDFVLRHIRSLDNDGRYEVWYKKSSDSNYTQISDYTGPSMMDGVARGKAGTVDISYGIYWGTRDRTGHTYIAHFDELRAFLGVDGFDDVDPASGACSVPTIIGKNVPNTALQQNYPNPFNPSTTIRYQLPQQSEIELTIYDILGKKVRTLVQGTQSVGIQQIVWDARNEDGEIVSAGLYFYRLHVRNEKTSFTEVKKLLLIK